MAESTAQHSRRREKPILSCSHCRNRKLRCDRQTPCGACVRRGMATECNFSVSELERSHAVDYRPHARRQQARQRVARLEGLVTEMRDQMQSLPGPMALSSIPARSPAVGTTTNDDMGKLSLTDDHVVYTGSSHWVTILEDIQRLKDELSDGQGMDSTKPDPEPSIATESPYADTFAFEPPAIKISLLNSGPVLSREQILLAVPSRQVADKHISDFFTNFDMAPFILHKSNFLAEYARFWDCPSSASMTWLGVLFGVFSMSSFLMRHSSHTNPGQFAPSATSAAVESMVQTYRAMTIHCLVAGDYLRPRQNTIEALILHFVVDQITNMDGTVSSWVLMGVIVRLALRMGLHRDPRHFLSFRPLEAEMRRRLWISLYQMDFFTSVQLGLARIIKDAQCDTQPPMYLASLDADDNFTSEQMLDAAGDSAVMPTPSLFIVQRNGIIQVAAAIYDATEEQEGPSHETLLFLESQLNAAILRIPASFAYSSFEESIADGPIITLHRIVLDILVQKTVYLLHRRSFFRSNDQCSRNDTDRETSVSQNKCIHAALSILKHQERLRGEISAGGQLYEIRWKVSASMNHGVLQAAMMLCFALSASSTALQQETRDEIFDALAKVKMQWEANPELSAEASKALHTISAILQRNQKISLTGAQEQGRATSDLPSAFDDVFDPMPPLSSQEYFDFNIFDCGSDFVPEPLEPLPYVPGFEPYDTGNNI